MDDNGETRDDLKCPDNEIGEEIRNAQKDEKDYQLIGLGDDFLSLMDDNGETRDDLKCPDNEIGEEIRNAQKDEKDILCTVLCAVNEECVIATKVNTAA